MADLQQKPSHQSTMFFQSISLHIQAFKCRLLRSNSWLLEL
ncbi:hypothetical protein OSB04_019932 [Centaurea solstitialis]|uniref:Uncharacterized protein n=1 Tax=Centaurea solstitialis TaxID=347529 RepID=A0AA38SSX1_9ASTR|nr:hypothetical protein OSB04_019932 [Centaurea solstitialis]